jgi:hypothetical protein
VSSEASAKDDYPSQRHHWIQPSSIKTSEGDGGEYRSRTDDLPDCKCQDALALLLNPYLFRHYCKERKKISTVHFCIRGLALLLRLRRIRRAMVENIGVEPMTSCLQSRRSSQLS